ncbi:MAG: hypothetical protein HYY64_09055 [Candidatus Rokubacteria bacterium]|nr:hypothetical protein [Candidatus Rokubacteria bacterium]
MTSRALVGGAALVGLLAATAWPLGAEEARPALNAPLILDLLTLPVENPEAAFQKSLRDAPVARSGPGWEALPDGSYRYGAASLNVIIKNPCPEGTHQTPLALPGRRR